MKILKPIFITIIIFFISCYIAFFFEEYFRNIVKSLFVYFSNNNITFEKPKGKYLRFTSGNFISSFGLYIAFFLFLIKKAKKVKYIWVVLATLLLFTLTTTIWCFIESHLIIIECTACDDGKRKMFYDEINFDRIFIFSLASSLLPILIKSTKKQDNAPKRI